MKSPNISTEVSSAKMWLAPPFLILIRWVFWSSLLCILTYLSRNPSGLGEERASIRGSGRYHIFMSEEIPHTNTEYIHKLTTWNQLSRRQSPIRRFAGGPTLVF